MQILESKYWQEGVDSKALLVCFLQKLPYLLLMGVAGAVLGSGLYLLIAVATSKGTIYQAETEYYIDFAEEILEAKHHYNDFTWNDVLATDLILGKTMDILGSNYIKSEVKSMITADILSDVRYLTITVEATDSEKVRAVSEATKQSLENFGSSMEEFDSIYQIENNGVQQVEKILFTWRSVLLGFLCGVLIGIFLIAAKFSLGSSYYTKHAISQSLGIPVFGLLYKSNNKAEGTQEKALQLAMQYRMEKTFCKQIVIADVINGGYAQKCKDILHSLYTEDLLGAAICAQDSALLQKTDYERIRQTDGVVLAIPFAKSCREAVIELLTQLENQDCNVLGAILIDVDPRWMKMYTK